MSVEQRFGPNTPAIERVLEQIANATPEQVAALGDALHAAWSASLEAVLDSAWDAACTAARDAGRDAAWDGASDAVWDATRDAVWDAASHTARDAACDAVEALVVADLVGSSHWLEQHHIDTLMGPYSSVFTDPREVVAA